MEWFLTVFVFGDAKCKRKDVDRYMHQDTRQIRGQTKGYGAELNGLVFFRPSGWNSW